MALGVSPPLLDNPNNRAPKLWAPIRYKFGRFHPHGWFRPPRPIASIFSKKVFTSISCPCSPLELGASGFPRRISVAGGSGCCISARCAAGFCSSGLADELKSPGAGSRFLAVLLSMFAVPSFWGVVPGVSSLRVLPTVALAALSFIIRSRIAGWV